MTSNDSTVETKVELKYCEGCGALMLRLCAVDQIYCRQCENKLANVARSTEPSRSRRRA